MNTNDAINRAQTPKVPEPPRTPAGAHVDINISSREKSKATVSTGSGRSRPAGWPKDAEEWKQLVRAALPWIAGAAIVIAATASVKKYKCEEEKDDMSYGELTSRKARRAAGKGEAAWDEAKDKTERTWFGFKRRAHETADDAADKLGSAKDTAARKARDAAKGSARDAQGYVKEKAHDAKEGAKEATWWASEKAHDAVDAAKGAAHKVEEKVVGVGSAALATASAAEEKTGTAMKNAGGKLEKDGRESKRFYRGEEVKAETKAKTGCSIM